MTAPRRAAIALLAAAAVDAAIVGANLGHLSPRTLFHAATALAQLAVASVLLLRREHPTARLVRLARVVAITTAIVVPVAVVARTLGLPIGGAHTGLPDLADGPLTAAALNVFGLVLLRRAARASPVAPQRDGRSARGAAAAIRAGAGWFAAVVLTTVGLLSGLSEVAAMRMVSGGGTDVTTLREPAGIEPVRSFALTAEPRSIGGHTYWTYNGMLPGPELRVAEGDRVRVTLANRLPVPTTIHWHGVSLPNAADGVAGLTQDAVQPGATYTYEFVAREVGTFWFHSHQDTFRQLLSGLYGALIVDPRAGHAAERDHTLFLHEVARGAFDPLSAFGALVVGAPGVQALAFNGRTGELRLDARPGERVRLRIIGAVQADWETHSILAMMRARPQELVLLGAEYEVAALDGRDINHPSPLGPQRLTVAIGQRYDLTFTMPAQGAVRLVDARGGESVTIGEGPYPPAPPLDQLPRFDALTYGAPAFDPVAGGRADVTYPMVLANHFGFREGLLQLVHTINGRSAPMGTDYPVRPGQVVRLEIENRTDEFHSMHLHGHPFSVVGRNGVPVQGSPLRLDSLLVGPRERWEIAFQADNPGLWMFHCHVLLHASFGMSATVSYPDIHAPFEMGARSGNKPE